MHISAILKENPNMVECIGKYNQKIKRVFDFDAYDAKPGIHNIIADINKIFSDKPVWYAERVPRGCKRKI